MYNVNILLCDCAAEITKSIIDLNLNIISKTYLILQFQHKGQFILPQMHGLLIESILTHEDRKGMKRSYAMMTLCVFVGLMK